MSTAEELRHDLIEALRASIGHEQTGTLMGYLPPVGWADVATKQDLAHQDALLRSELARQRAEIVAEVTGTLNRDIGTLNRDIGTMIRNFGFALTAAYTAVAGLALTASQLL